MLSALIVTHLKKEADGLESLLKSASFLETVVLTSCSEARRLLIDRDFDLIVINSPLADETGEILARHVARNGVCQVLLLVKSEFFEAVSAICESDGVLTISKPINKTFFWSALSLAKATGSRLKRAQIENAKLKQKIEDIRIIDRAKCVLISHMSISENDAHRYIEKQAMDMRTTRREVAESILKTYEN